MAVLRVIERNSDENVDKVILIEELHSLSSQIGERFPQRC